MGKLANWRLATAFGTALCATVILGSCSTEAIPTPELPTVPNTIEYSGALVTPDEKSGRPKCNQSKSIPLGASAPISKVANAISPWKEIAVTLQAEESFYLGGVIALDESLSGFINFKKHVEAGETISLNASQFTVMPDIAASLSKIDSVTLCIVQST